MDCKHDTTDFFQVYASELRSPEKKLLVAVIQRAIDDFYMIKSKPWVAWEAGKWLFSESRAVMSLCWICDHLSDDGESLRRGVINLVKKRNRALRFSNKRVD